MSISTMDNGETFSDTTNIMNNKSNKDEGDAFGYGR